MFVALGLSARAGVAVSVSLLVLAAARAEIRAPGAVFKTGSPGLVWTPMPQADLYVRLQRR